MAGTFVQAQTSLEQYQGIWVRKDVLETMKASRSFFHTKKISDSRAFKDKIALGIYRSQQRAGQLGVQVLGFGETIMPTSTFVPLYQTKYPLGYPIQVYGATLYLQFKGDQQLLVTTPSRQVLIFERIRKQAPRPLENLFVGLMRHIIIGSYVLKDTNNRVIQSHVWFDQNGLTSFPKLRLYQVIGGYWHSPHNKANTHIAKYSSVIDQEEILLLYNPKDDFLQKQQYILQKVKNGFHVYAMKAPIRMKWQLVYKKELVYQLIYKY